MTRTIPAAFATALGGDAIQPFYAIDLLFDSPNSMYLWTGFGDKTIWSNTYAGVGDAIQVSETGESSDLSVKGLTLTLSGVKSSLVTKALAEPYQNRTCKLYFGLIGQSDVIELFTGRMDKMVIRDGPETATIALSVEHKLAALERAVVRRYTEESHKALTTGTDTFFTFLADLQDKPIVWGKPSS